MGQAGVPSGDTGRDGQGRFAKGQSGNPKGRTPISPEVREAASPHTVEAVAVLVEVLNSPSATLPMRSMAALGILRAASSIQAVQPPKRASAYCKPLSNASEAYLLAMEVLRSIASDKNAPISARAKATSSLRRAMVRGC